MCFMFVLIWASCMVLGFCVKVCGVVCVVVCCLFLKSGCCLFLKSGCCLLCCDVV